MLNTKYSPNVETIDEEQGGEEREEVESINFFVTFTFSPSFFFLNFYFPTHKTPLRFIHGHSGILERGKMRNMYGEF